MTVKIELTPDIEESLAAQAHARGIALDAYLQSVIEDLVRSRDSAPATLADLRTTLDTLAEMGKELPSLPSSAFSRESMYEHHD